MPIIWKPNVGTGYWINGKLIGDGLYINQTTCVIQKGLFNESGQLDSKACETINYSDSANVVVRLGPFTAGNEHGHIVEYVFPKARWTDFTNGVSISTTKYIQNYSNGVWRNTVQTKNNTQLTGTFTSQNGIWTDVEVAEH